MKKPRILIVGSFTMDLITSTRVFPGGGETVLGTDFSSAPGGKGANQAVQAARLGADVTVTGDNPDLVATHYGDCPAPEIFVINTNS